MLAWKLGLMIMWSALGMGERGTDPTTFASNSRFPVSLRTTFCSTAATFFGLQGEQVRSTLTTVRAVPTAVAKPNCSSTLNRTYIATAAPEQFLQLREHPFAVEVSRCLSSATLLEGHQQNGRNSGVDMATLLATILLFDCRSGLCNEVTKPTNWRWAH